MNGPSIPSPPIHLKGAREHNLKNIELRLPRGRLTVITGVSGSGKSSLAFDTLYAEASRQYMDSLSTRARAVLDQIKRPEIDFIHGLSPVIAIEQRTLGSTNPRSTVATVTEIADYARLLWALCGQAHCPLDGAPIARRSLDDCLTRIFQEPNGTRLVLLAPWMKARASVLREELPNLRQRGFQRVRIDGAIRDLDDRDVIPAGARESSLDIVIDRVVIEAGQRARLADSLELAFREGKDRAVALVERSPDRWEEIPLSQHFACSKCGEVYEPISPKHFSPNHPEGACPDCGGLGRTMQFSPGLVVPDASLTVRHGALKPLRFGSKRIIIRHNAMLKQLAEQLPFDPDLPWRELPEEQRRQILHGAGERLFTFKLQSGNRKPEVSSWAGVLAELERMRQETSSDGLRARLMSFQTGSTCPSCAGRRLRPLSLAVRLGGLDYAAFLRFDIAEAAAFIERLTAANSDLNRLADAVEGLRQRLRFLDEVGLGYLTLDREYASLSGGEAQRVRLATQLGMGLVGVIYILDEPSIGLHALDNRKLLRNLLDLRDRGNTIVVVEHDEETIRAADWLVELGPGAGPQGGEVVFAGTPLEAIASARAAGPGKIVAVGSGSQIPILRTAPPASLTGYYLGGLRRLEQDSGRRRVNSAWIVIRGARAHNLRIAEAAFPIGLLTCVAGVSGSGKSTLVNDILGAAAAFKLNRAKAIPLPHDGIEGLDCFQSVVRVDQDPIGKSPRSNPATFTHLFDDLRALYAQTSLARVRGYGPGRFSFNVRGGRCERCQGDGMIRLDMQFLADVYADCPGCQGRRYNRETLEIRYKGLNIAEALQLTVDEALGFFRSLPRLQNRLQTLSEVGLGYLQLGQPGNTLSGGEAQRLKLALELAKRPAGGALYLLDEPTTGLHWADIQQLMDLLFRLRDAGHTIVMIEHHLDVLKMADWVLELGPGGGRAGGQIVYAGPPEGLRETPASPTGQCLREKL